MASKEPNVDTIEMKENESVFHFTDIEGRWELLRRAIDNFNIEREESAKIQIKPDESGAEYIHIPDNVKIIFGGDATDKGPNDLRIRRLFVKTKKMYMDKGESDRFILIAGNRDYIDVRRHIEVHKQDIINTFESSRRPEWIKDDKRVTFENFALVRLLDEANWSKFVNKSPKNIPHTSSEDDKIAALRELLGQPANVQDNLQAKEVVRKSLLDMDETKLKLLYLEWQSVYTMTSPDKLKFRREELAAEKKKTSGKDEIVSEKEMVDSLCDSKATKEYLELTQVAVKVGNEKTGYELFTHGGLTQQAMEVSGTKHTTLDTWIPAINEHVQSEIKEIFSTDYKPGKFYSDIERFSLPNGLTGQLNDTRKGTPISVECWKEQEVSLSNGKVVKQVTHYLEPEILKMLNNENVHGMATGHKPTGSSELGTIYVTKLEDGTSFTLCTPDITFGKEDGKKSCAVVYTWTKNGIQAEMTSHSAAFKANIIAKPPKFGNGLKANAKLYSGMTFYAPDFNTYDKGSVTATNIIALGGLEADKVTDFYAWNIILVEPDGENPTKIILQRMDVFAAKQIVIDASDNSDEKKAQIANLLSYSNVVPIKPTEKMAEQVIVVASTQKDAGEIPKVERTKLWSRALFSNTADMVENLREFTQAAERILKDLGCESTITHDSKSNTIQAIITETATNKNQSTIDHNLSTDDIKQVCQPNLTDAQLQTQAKANAGIIRDSFGDKKTVYLTYENTATDGIKKHAEAMAASLKGEPPVTFEITVRGNPILTKEVNESINKVSVAASLTANINKV